MSWARLASMTGRGTVAQLRTLQRQPRLCPTCSARTAVTYIRLHGERPRLSSFASSCHSSPVISTELYDALARSSAQTSRARLTLRAHRGRARASYARFRAFSVAVKSSLISSLAHSNVGGYGMRVRIRAGAQHRDERLICNLGADRNLRRHGS